MCSLFYFQHNFPLRRHESGFSWVYAMYVIIKHCGTIKRVKLTKQIGWGNSYRKYQHLISKYHFADIRRHLKSLYNLFSCLQVNVKVIQKHM